jgi:EamA domain-containing membrane protein RarD
MGNDLDRAKLEANAASGIERRQRNVRRHDRTDALVYRRAKRRQLDLIERWSAVAWSRGNVVALLYLSVIGSVVAFSIYYHLIKRMDATIVSLSTLVFPIVALALGRVFLHETVTPTAVGGIATFLTGVAVAIVPGGAPATDVGKASP